MKSLIAFICLIKTASAFAAVPVYKVTINNHSSSHKFTCKVGECFQREDAMGTCVTKTTACEVVAHAYTSGEIDSIKNQAIQHANSVANNANQDSKNYTNKSIEDIKANISDVFSVGVAEKIERSLSQKINSSEIKSLIRSIVREELKNVRND